MQAMAFLFVTAVVAWAAFGTPMTIVSVRGAMVADVSTRTMAEMQREVSARPGLVRPHS